MTDHTGRMPGFVLDHLHRSGWTAFRDVQERAFDVLFGTDRHLLIASGTSSGKTEAALIPVVSSLFSDPVDSIGAMYVGPTKALIDDQFARMERMLRESRIPVNGWHGDVDANRKERLLAEPEGILQITPESLEGILDNHSEDVPRMFGSLRFVIVDEVHSFMASDRGLQLMCEIGRIRRACGCAPRMIGLSATLSDTAAAAEWLTSGAEGEAEVVASDDRRSCRVGIKHFRFPPEDPEGSRRREVSRYYSELFRLTDPYACIVFTNSRAGAERTARSLARVSEAKGSRNPVRVHHGSLSGSMRRTAEDDLRSGFPATVVATVTLELGVDIGGLDRVVQIGAPYSCSSLVQRMGRSGRRNGRQEMVMFCNDDDGEWRPGIEGVSLELARGIAETELYLGEGWTEPVSPDPLPFGLLFHQTLAALKGARRYLRFGDLCDEVLSLSPFSSVTRDDYRILLKHMINKRTLIQTEDLTLLIGPKAEPVAFGRDFSAVFEVRDETEIRAGGSTIGTVQGSPEPGATVALAGRVWRVVRRGDGWAEAVETDGEADARWRSDPPDIHTRVMSEVRDVLLSDDDYPYLDSSAREELAASRRAFRASGAGDVFVPTESGFDIYPWLGTVQFDTLRRMLGRVAGVRVSYAYSPLVIGVSTRLTATEIRRALESIRRDDDPVSLLDDRESLRLEKYDGFVPDALLADAFCARRIDMGFNL